MKRLLPALVTAALSATASLAHSSTLIGSKATDGSYDPSSSTPSSFSGMQAVNGTIEFQSGSEMAITGAVLIGTNVAVSASSVDLTFTENAMRAVAAFNGDAFDFSVSGPIITGVSLDPLSEFSGSQIGLSFGQHEIEVDESGLLTWCWLSAQALVCATLDLAPTHPT